MATEWWKPGIRLAGSKYCTVVTSREDSDTARVYNSLHATCGFLVLSWLLVKFLYRALNSISSFTVRVRECFGDQCN